MNHDQASNFGLPYTETNHDKPIHFNVFFHEINHPFSGTPIYGNIWKAPYFFPHNPTSLPKFRGVHQFIHYFWRGETFQGESGFCFGHGTYVPGSNW